MRASTRWPALAIVLALPCTGARGADPQWDGRPLSYWVGLLREVPKDERSASADWRKAPWAISKIGVSAIPSLITTLGDPKAQVRLRAIRPLVAMGSAASDAAPALTARLNDEDVKVRQWSAVALGTIGAPAAGAVPTLIAALKDPEPPVRQAAAAALGSMGSEDAIAPLEEALSDPSVPVQRAARLSLDRLRPSPTPSPKS
jgi:HEAT repeat protein